jgi:hypothetical protein
VEEFREAVRKDHELIYDIDVYEIRGTNGMKIFSKADKEALENILYAETDDKPQFDPEYIGENENPTKKKKQEIFNELVHLMDEKEKSFTWRHPRLPDDSGFFERKDVMSIVEKIINKYL